MRNEYTITTGQLSCANEHVQIPLALVLSDEGVFAIEIFLPSVEFYETSKNKGFFTLKGKTEKGYDIEIDKLSFRRFSYEHLKIEFICYGAVKLIDTGKKNLPNTVKSNRKI